MRPRLHTTCVKHLQLRPLMRCAAFFVDVWQLASICHSVGAYYAALKASQEHEYAFLVPCRVSIAA